MITTSLSCSDEALAAIERHTQAHLDGEVGGFLLGVIADGAVDVRVALPATEAVGGRAQVTFTHADWDAAHRAVDHDHPDLRIVGWYHSHPGFGIFLSEYDRFIHRNFFSDPEMVALVRDPHDGAFGWFGWSSGEIALIEGSDGVDGRSPVDSGAAPVSLAGRSQTGRGRAGRLVLAGFAVLLAGFAAGWVLSPDGRAAQPEIAGTAGLEVALADAQAQLLAAQDRVDDLVVERDGLRDALDEEGDAQDDGQSAAAPVVTYRVRPGDTLSSLAEAFYGSAVRFEDLAEANDLTDPGALDVGQRLDIPTVP